MMKTPDEPVDGPDTELGVLLPPPGWPTRMDEKAFYGLAGDIVRTLEPETESDPNALLAQLLAGFGNVVGGEAYFEVEAVRHPPKLFVCVVGRTAKARKGTSFSHVEALLGAADSTWHKHRIVRGVSSGEGLLMLVRDRNASEPGVEDKRLFLFESEFAGMLRIMGRPGNSLSKIVRQGWDGRTLDTVTKHSPLRATNTHISIVGHVTLEELRADLRQTEMFSGFFNRFLPVCACRSKLLPHGGKLSAEDLRGLTRRLASSIRFARDVTRIKFSAGGSALWNDRYSALTADLPGLVGAVTARAETQVLRIALIYALMDESDDIRKQHLEAAIAVWNYCLESAKFIFGSPLIATLKATLEPKLLEVLRKSQTSGMTRTQISAALNNHYSSEILTSVLERLGQRGLAESRTERTEGRPAKRWFAIESNGETSKGKNRKSDYDVEIIDSMDEEAEVETIEIIDEGAE